MKKKSAGSVAIMLLVMIYLLIPLVISIIYSVFHKWTGVIPEGFTLHNYVDLFTDSNFLASVGRSIAMSIIPIIVTIVIVLLALFVTAIYFPKLEKYVQIICMIPYTIQGVILSVSILSLYVGSSSILSNRLVMLMAKQDSIRDVIAFPKIKDASCLMTEAPTPADTKQLEELGLEVVTEEK